MARAHTHSPTKKPKRPTTSANRRVQDETPKRWLTLGRMLRVCLMLALIGAASVAGIFYYYGQDPTLPQIGAIKAGYQPESVTRILDRKGILIGETSAERRTVVPFEKFPKVLVHAVVDAEDAEFFNHRGLDYIGMLRAFLVNLRAQRFVQGGSTITQQVVKTFFLTPERTLKRKLQEVILARRLENELTKEDILFLYLNQIYFGHGRYGVQEASRFFFQKDVSELSIGEAALLAGLPQAPNRLSPLRHPERAKKRQSYVLKEMVKRGHLDETTAQKLIDAPLAIAKDRQTYYNVCAEVNEIVRDYLFKAFGEAKMKTLGLTVRTTIDAALQKAAREAVQAGLRAIDQRNRFGEPVTVLKPKDHARKIAALKQRQTHFKEGHVYEAIVLRTDDSEQMLHVTLGGEETAIEFDHPRYMDAKRKLSKRFPSGSVIRLVYSGGQFQFLGGPEAALVALDPVTGDVLAMVGGYQMQPGQFNRALRALRQPGSSFKPFVYGAAIETGRYTPATIVDDSPVVFKDWEPKNFDGIHRGPIRLREGLTHSINTVSAKIVSDIGVNAVRNFAERLGIRSPLGQDLSLALGSSVVTVGEMARAYAAIANGGNRIDPRYVLEVSNEPIAGSAPEPVISPETAFLLTSLMQSVIDEGTGQKARSLGHLIAGKTGTTNDQLDAWFIGFTPTLVTAVWVGFDLPRSLGRKETGAHAALPIWLTFMQHALKGKPRLPFKQPAGIVVERIDPQTGLLAPESSTTAIEEFFASGTEPKETAPSGDDVDPNLILLNPVEP